MMPSRSIPLIAIAMVAACLWPTSAHADGFISPGIGGTFGTPSASGGRPSFVLDAGWLSRAPIGMDVDATFAPNFFGNQGGSNNVTTVTANIIVASTEGDRYRRFRRFRSTARPYITFGLGLMHENVTNPSASAADLGADIGVGIMVIPRHQIGLRADIRYFRNFVSQSNGTNIDFGAFHFWRASLGVVFRFGMRD